MDMLLIRSLASSPRIERGEIRHTFLFVTFGVALLAAALGGCAHRSLVHDAISLGSAELKLIVRLDQSASLVDALMSSPDKGIPREIIGPRCLHVLPGCNPTVSLWAPSGDRVLFPAATRTAPDGPRLVP